MILAVVTFLIFALLIAGLATATFGLTDAAAAWVGAGVIGLSATTSGAWSVVLSRDMEMGWARRVGGDLLLLAIAVGLLVTGIAVFAAGVV